MVAQVATQRTARAWLYKVQLREILDRKQVSVVRAMLWQWTINVMRSKVEPMKAVAKMICNHGHRGMDPHPAGQRLDE